MKPDETWKSFPAWDIPSTLDIHPILFDYITPESRILDLGCGAGRTCAWLYGKSFRNVFGTDVNSEAIGIARKKLSVAGMIGPGSRFIVSENNTIPFPDEYFDCVTCQALWTTVLKPDRIPLMKEIARVLRPGGILYISDFARTPENPLYNERYIKGIKEGLDEGSFLVSAEDGSVKYVAHHYSIEEFEKLITATGMSLKKTETPHARTRTGNKINGLVLIALKPR